MTDDEILPGEPDEPTHEIVPLEEEAPKATHRDTFAAYKRDARNWITLVTGEYYPDILVHACALYQPVLERSAICCVH